MSKVNEIRANSLLGDFGVIYALTGWLYTRSPRSISFSSSQSQTNDILQVKNFPNIMIKVELGEKYKKRLSMRVWSIGRNRFSLLRNEFPRSRYAAEIQQI